MADRALKAIPPSEDYEQDRWHCIYHSGLCDNPLDCDLIPTWRLKDEVARRVIMDPANLDRSLSRSHFFEDSV